MEMNMTCLSCAAQALAFCFNSSVVEDLISSWKYITYHMTLKSKYRYASRVIGGFTMKVASTTT